MTSEARSALERIEGRIVVSCQAYPGEPLRFPEAMAAMAASAVIGGAGGIRAQGLEDLRLIRSTVDVPLIGLVKRGSEGVFITPTVADAVEVARAGSDIVAIDATDRPRPDGSSLVDSVRAIHAEGALVMGDCGCLDDALAAVAAGVDCVGTTLAGYTGVRARTDGPDLELLAQIVGATEVPVLAEGRVGTPEQARACFEVGAFAAVVGTAITHPASLTRRFVGRAPRA